MVESLAGLIQNVFEEVASHMFLDLGWLQGELSDLTPNHFHLTGAGPALFGLPSNESEYQRVAEALSPYGVEVHLVHTMRPHAPAGVGS